MINRPVGNGTGVSFNGTHSYSGWGLRLAELSIGQPSPRTIFIDVPGRNGSLDLTEAQHGGVVYANRTLLFKFDAFASFSGWAAMQSTVANAIHGKKVRIVLDTDPNYYYYGRCTVETEKTGATLASVTITCDCEPFKRPVSSLNELSNMAINSPSAWKEVSVQGWTFNEALEITCSADMTLKYSGVEYALGRGINIMTQFSLSEGANLLYLKGTGTVTITQQGGML